MRCLWHRIICSLGMEILLVFSLSIKAESIPPPKRDKDAGALSYERLQNKYAHSKGAKETVKFLLDVIKASGLTPETVSMDIFLPEGKQERDRFKRIIIPNFHYVFMQAMYEGMMDYVKSGGLLITNSSLICIDNNCNYKYDPLNGDKIFAKKKPLPLIGLHGHSTASAHEIKILSACPLTKGFKEGETIKFTSPLSVRLITNFTATVLVDSSVSAKGKTYLQRPFVSFLHSGNGACIYIAPSFTTQPGTIFLKNALSVDTLDWLTMHPP